jgi:preprotein translocase subunit SecD
MKSRLILCISIVLLSLYFAASNFFDSRFLSDKQINLGLDLKGGSYLLLKIKFEHYLQEVSGSLLDDVRVLLQKNKINYSELSALHSGVEFRLNNRDDAAQVKKYLRSLGENYNIEGESVLHITFNKAYLQELRLEVAERTMKSIRRRVDEAGVKEALLQFRGDDSILLQMPGMESPEQVKALLGKTAKLTFHLLADESTQSRKLLTLHSEQGREYRLYRKAELTGNLLKKAVAGFNSYGQPVVHFVFNSSGAERLARITRENVGKVLAIVLDNTVITAPLIRETILGGQGEISGDFDINVARDLAIMLRSGALPAPLEIAEQSTVGPSLGADSIMAGKRAVAFAFICVVLFMLVSYSRFGVYAVSALLINLVIMVAVLTILEATLTLPGIAGIVLTIGMAVDANVLIFERIREEGRIGRNAVAAVERGFHRAFAAIFDSNMTTIIAAMIMFAVGVGPIRGFAVTLSIGILSSMFSAVFFTKIMIMNWARRNCGSEKLLL